MRWWERSKKGRKRRWLDPLGKHEKVREEESLRENGSNKIREKKKKKNFEMGRKKYDFIFTELLRNLKISRIYYKYMRGQYSFFFWNPHLVSYFRSQTVGLSDLNLQIKYWFWRFFLLANWPFKIDTHYIIKTS